MSESKPRQAPRYTGVRTFAGLPMLAPDQLNEKMIDGDAVVMGAPFDTATSWRPGARFGPEGIRSASALLRPWHPLHEVDVFGEDSVLDAGDIAITPGNAARSAEQIAETLRPISGSGIIPLVLGGDHSVLLGELRAGAAAHGPLAVVLFDAHADTWDEYYGESLFHGTVLRRAVEEKLIDPNSSIIAGIRGPVYAPSDLEDARDLGFELVGIDELRATPPSVFATRVREKVGETAAFLSFDIDVVDPSAAPGTGTPEPGGLLAAEALTLLRALSGMSFVGFDVVEVSPVYDSPGQITCLLAANIAYEMLALAALSRRR